MSSEGELEGFAIDRALDAAWYTQWWIPRERKFGFIDYFEAAATRNLGLLHGFEKLGEDAARRGILPPTTGEQATLVTDGGHDVETPSGISRDDLVRRGNLTSDDHRAAYHCEACRHVLYAQERPVICPFCKSDAVEESGKLPGALLLNPGVEWPEDDPFVGGESDS